jgi:two-component system, LytTR family, sensor kinase
MPSLKSFIEAPKRLFWSLQVTGWLGYVVLHLVEGINVGSAQYLTYSRGSLMTAALGFAITSALRVGYARVWNLSPKRLVFAASLMLIAAALLYGKLYAEVMFVWCAVCERPENFIGYGWYVAAMSYVLIAWTGLYFGIKFARQFQQQKEAALTAQMTAQMAQLRMLRYQLNPHFLFNTLNSLSALMLDGKSGVASDMVESLGNFLRYSLDSDPVQRVALAEEVESIRQYLGIEQLRFADRLRVRIDLEPRTRDALVPSMILQPLVENAIKFAVAGREEGGRIDIQTQCNGGVLDIRLSDDGTGFMPSFTADTTTGGVGLANTRERLKVLYGEQAQLFIGQSEPRGTQVHLRMPFETATAPR